MALRKTNRKQREKHLIDARSTNKETREEAIFSKFFVETTKRGNSINFIVASIVDSFEKHPRNVRNRSKNFHKHFLRRHDDTALSMEFPRKYTNAKAVETRLHVNELSLP
jgi:hypothetical protein